MRWYILRTLWHKELLRHAANRGGILLVVLLMLASLLLSFFGGRQAEGTGGLGGARYCYVDYWRRDALIDHLEKNQPAELTGQLRFRPISQAPRDGRGRIRYVNNTGAIQIRNGDPSRHTLVWFWQPTEGGLAQYESWFWRESRRHVTRQANALLQAQPPSAKTRPLPEFQEKHSTLKGGLDPRTGIATALVTFGLFFVCVYLMPSMSCEERERGTLLAQALSPAAPLEILAAKFLFYPIIAMLLAAVLAGTYQPHVLLQPFFWLALGAVVMGSMGIGLTIASIARTQRAASMGAMGYMFIITLFLFICQTCNIPGLPGLALEYHGPRMIHAIFADAVQLEHWLSMLVCVALAATWIATATYLFRRTGWQS